MCEEEDRWRGSRRGPPCGSVIEWDIKTAGVGLVRAVQSINVYVYVASARVETV